MTVKVKLRVRVKVEVKLQDRSVHDSINRVNTLLTIHFFSLSAYFSENDDTDH